jgi:hypothetical protein
MHEVKGVNDKKNINYTCENLTTIDGAMED